MRLRSLFFREGCLRKDDLRVRKVPLFFGRPNLTELTRVYTELVSATVSDRDELASSPVEVPSSQSVDSPKTPDKAKEPFPADNSTEALHRFWRAVTADDAATVAAEVAAAPQNAFLW